MAEFHKDILVHGVPAGEIAGVVERVAGDFAGKNQGALRGVCQAMRDMEDSRLFGTGLRRVLRYHFPKASGRCDPACLTAVEEVFMNGISRCRDWKILGIAYTDADGFDKGVIGGRVRDMILKYGYLGADALQSGALLVYYGVLRRYKVEAGAFRYISDAHALAEYLRAKSLPCTIQSEGGYHKVRVGSYVEERRARDLLPLIRSLGIRAPYVVSEL